MADLNKFLASVYEITKKSMAVLSAHCVYIFPEAAGSGITFEEAANADGGFYKGYSVHRLKSPAGLFLLCIQSEFFERNETTELIILGVENALRENSPDIETVKGILSGDLKEHGFIELPDNLREALKGYVVVIGGCGEFHDEAGEILVNTAEVLLHFELKGKLFAVIKADDIEETCSQIYKNIVSELFVESSIAVGGLCGDIDGLKRLYENCLEALLFKKLFSLKEHVLLFDRMYSYRIASGLGKRLKEDLLQSIFTPEFRELMSSEMNVTIEEFFNNNLNLTDTAAKLYVHRNTLLYRLDKIYKTTGYDLKKFEDSWLFRLAWLVYKERQGN